MLLLLHMPFDCEMECKNCSPMKKNFNWHEENVSKQISNFSFPSGIKFFILIRFSQINFFGSPWAIDNSL